MADTPGAPKSPWEEREHERFRRYEEKLRRRIERRSRRWEARVADGHYLHSGFRGALIGLILAGIGVLLLLQNLGIIIVEDLWDYWPVILIVLGLSRMATAWSVHGRVVGGILTAVGSAFLLRTLGIIQGNIWGFFWPAILIAIGLAMLLRAFDVRGMPLAGGWRPDLASSDESTVNTADIHAVFSHADRRFDTQQFEGGEVNAVFGGVELDLRKAAMKGDQVRLDCNAVFGGIDVTVPETWTVLMRGTGIFGGFSDETVPPVRGDVKSPILLVTGGAVFGGVTVKN